MKNSLFLITFHRILDYDAITATPESRKIFRDMLVRSGHADPINDPKIGLVPLVSETPKMTGTGGVERNIPDIRNAPRKQVYIEDNSIDKEYFKDLDSPFYEGEKILQRYDTFEDLAINRIKTIAKENNTQINIPLTGRTLDQQKYIDNFSKELKADALMKARRRTIF